MTLPSIQVDEKKLGLMMAKTWSPLEQPLVAVPIEYRLEARKKALRAGFLLITRGAVYVFKSKFMKPVVIDRKLHILDMRQVNIPSGTMMVIEFDEFNFEISSQFIIPIYVAIMTVLREVTYGVCGYIEFEVHSSIALPPVEIDQRMQQAIKWRILFLAHFYDLRSGQLDTLTFFDKWEEFPTPMIVLGPNFHPGNLAAAFGHALGWESRIDTCCFQSFAPTSFARMLLSILDNAATIDRLAFADYKKGESRGFPTFPTTSILHTSIKEWWILRSSFEMVETFCQFAKQLPEPISSFMIATTPISNKQFEIFNSMVNDTPALKYMKGFSYVRNPAKKIPVSKLKILLGITTQLQSLSIRGLECNGSELLSSICSSGTHIRVLNVTHMQFKTQVAEKHHLPSTLVNLNLSLNSMGPATFRSIIQLILRDPRVIPITLQMRGMVLRESCYNALEGIQLDKCNPAIGELDWSGNKMPLPNLTRYFFTILSTQTRLRHLKLDDMECADPMQFLLDVIRLMNMIHVPGFDVSGKFDPTMMNQFINALGQMTWLRRLGIRSSKCGDQGIPTILNLARTLKNLDEFLIDGLRLGSVPYVINTWGYVAKENIPALDLPTQEMKNLDFTERNLSDEQKALFKLAQDKKRPTTIEQRTAYIISKIEEIEKLKLPEAETNARLAEISSPDLFKNAVDFKLSDKHRDDDPYAEKPPGEVDD